jgi:hypothetical protein
MAGRLMGIFSYILESSLFGYLLITKRATNEVLPLVVLPVLGIGMILVMG